MGVIRVLLVWPSVQFKEFQRGWELVTGKPCILQGNVQGNFASSDQFTSSRYSRKQIACRCMEYAATHEGILILILSHECCGSPLVPSQYIVTFSGILSALSVSLCGGILPNLLEPVIQSLKGEDWEIVRDTESTETDKVAVFCCWWISVVGEATTTWLVNCCLKGVLMCLIAFQSDWLAHIAWIQLRIMEVFEMLETSPKLKTSLPKKQWFVDFQRPKIRPELLFETKLLCQFSATQPFIVECMTSKMFGFLKGHIQCMRFAVLCTVEIIEKLAHASKNSFEIKCTKWFMLRLSEHLLIISSTGLAMWWCAVLQGHWNTALCSPRFVPQQSTAMGEKW